MPHIALEGAPNFRDLGGYRTADGRVVRSGVVFRSGHLANLSDSDLERLREIGVKTVIDFRPRTEREMTGHDRLPEGADYVEYPIGDPEMTPLVRKALEQGDFTVLPDLAEANRSLIRDFAGEMGKLLRLVSDEQRLPVIFHCIGGKDRTGVAAALLLSVLGVPWADVRSDYLRTNDRIDSAGSSHVSFLERIVRSYAKAELTEENLAALRRFFVLEPAYIEAVRDEITRLAGSLPAYTRHWLGLTDEVVERLRGLLLEPVSS